MQYRALGRSGLIVSRLILGSTMFGELMDAQASRSVLHRAWDFGINTIDTGDIYAGGRSEEIIGSLTATRRQQLVLCTKVGFRVGGAPEEHAAASAGRLDHRERWTRGIAPHDQGLSRQHIVGAVEASLKRLKTDYIDLYQLHRWDPSVPIEETLRALDDLVRSGKVRYIGCSNARGWQLFAALWQSDVRGLTRLESMQVPYSLLAREAEADALPACMYASVGVIAYQVLAAGALSGLHNEGVKPGTVMAQRPAHQERFLAAEQRERLVRFKALADKAQRSPVTLALSAVLAHPAITAATIGMQNPEEIQALVDAIEQPLSEELYGEVRAVFS